MNFVVTQGALQLCAYVHVQFASEREGEARNLQESNWNPGKETTYWYHQWELIIKNDEEQFTPASRGGGGGIYGWGSGTKCSYYQSILWLGAYPVGHFWWPYHPDCTTLLLSFHISVVQGMGCGPLLSTDLEHKEHSSDDAKCILPNSPWRHDISLWSDKIFFPFHI